MLYMFQSHIAKFFTVAVTVIPSHNTTEYISDVDALTALCNRTCASVAVT